MRGSSQWGSDYDQEDQEGDGDYLVCFPDRLQNCWCLDSTDITSFCRCCLVVASGVNAQHTSSQTRGASSTPPPSGPPPSSTFCPPEMVRTLTHTHNHTCTYTYTQSQAHVHTLTCTRTHTHMHTYTHVNAYQSAKCVNKQLYTDEDTCTNIHTYTNIRIQIQTRRFFWWH